MKGTKFSVTTVNVRDFRFGSKGLLKERNRSTRRACDDGSQGLGSVSCLTTDIECSSRGGVIEDASRCNDGGVAYLKN